MLYDIIQDEEFGALLKNHCYEILTYLFEKDEEFAVLADLKQIDFNPALPKELFESLPEFTLFMLANYTYESAKIEDGNLLFEAGFGPQNFGSIVTIPLEAILQIIIDDTPIFVNLTASLGKRKKKKRASFLSNPENQKFLKK